MLYKPIEGAILKFPLKGYEFIVRTKGTVILILFPSTLILSEIITKFTTYFFLSSKNVLSTGVFNKVTSPVKGVSEGKTIFISLLTTLVAFASNSQTVL